MNKKKVLTCS